MVFFFFFCGMSTTQIYESINSFFDKYVGYNKTTLNEFVEKYIVSLQDREETKKQVIDFNT